VVGAAAAVIDVDLLEAFGGDGLELLLGGAGVRVDGVSTDLRLIW
jgi:hypothetical protein